MNTCWIVDKQTDVGKAQNTLHDANITSYAFYFANAENIHKSIVKDFLNSNNHCLIVFVKNVQVSPSHIAYCAAQNDYDIIHIAGNDCYMLSRRGAQRFIDYAALLPPNLIMKDELAIIPLIPNFAIYKFESGSMKMICINLKRRPDRKLEFMTQMRRAGVDEYEFADAADGKAITRTPDIIKLFDNNTFGWRRGAVGAAMSHYGLWKRLVADAENDYYIIFEDDITLVSRFKEHLATVFEMLKTKQWDLVWLGYHMWSHDLQRSPQYRRLDAALRLAPLDTTKIIGGAFGYIISKECARKYVDYIAANGIKHAIDELMTNHNNRRPLHLDLHITHLEVVPHIVLSDWVEPGADRAVDSDIQRDHVAL